MKVFVAVFLVLQREEVVMAVIAPPTSVCATPATTVTAPDADPRLMISHSNPKLLASAPPRIPASVRVPVGSVSETAVADVQVMMNVSSWAIVTVALALIAVGAPCEKYIFVVTVRLPVVTAALIAVLRLVVEDIAPLSDELTWLSEVF